MEHETSKFESSETLAMFLVSTSLLEESWRLCSHANTAAHRSFVVEKVGEVAYVAFSGVQMAEDYWLGDWEAVDGIFRFFSRRVDAEEAPAVRSGLLQLFLSFYNSDAFQGKIHETLNGCKSVVFTGHSLGGAIASLSALWCLSDAQSTSSSTAIFCITYGAPMLGNKQFSRAIFQQRWAGKFCHVVAQHDLLPRLVFDRLHSTLVPRIRAIFHLWHSSLASHLIGQLSEETKHGLLDVLLPCMEEWSRRGEDHETSSFWPFGSYLFCTDKGSICLDNAMSIARLLYVTMANGCGRSCIEDHFKYEDYVGKLCLRYLFKTGDHSDMWFSELSNDAGIAMALCSAGLNPQDSGYEDAKCCLVHARQQGCNRNLNNAKMAVALAKITPLRAQIEWYKAFCDDSNERLGYYDSFKQRGACKKGFRVNWIRIRLGQFWDELIEKIEANKLTHDFHKLAKYVNASQFYKLLVEPLEIAEYYRTGEHWKRGHYMDHGRARRFKIFDKWWADRRVGDEENNPRSKFASFTQDSCFWARVEEARDCVSQLRHVQADAAGSRFLVLLECIEKFEQYANKIIHRKEVSVDVLAQNSSYNLFRAEWKELISALRL